MAVTIRINDFMSGMFAAIGIKLVDFKIEFGRQYEGDMVRTCWPTRSAPIPAGCGT
jgi:phosphoribosylaminoimidazole-succinocarboxamide synthase